MENLDPQVVSALLATSCAGLMMVYAGLRKHTLEWRRPGRRCPSCGRQIRNRTCGCAA